VCRLEINWEGREQKDGHGKGFTGNFARSGKSPRSPTYTHGTHVFDIIYTYTTNVYAGGRSGKGFLKTAPLRLRFFLLSRHHPRFVLCRVQPAWPGRVNYDKDAFSRRASSFRTRDVYHVRARRRNRAFGRSRSVLSRVPVFASLTSPRACFSIPRGDAARRVRPRTARDRTNFRISFEMPWKCCRCVTRAKRGPAQK